MLGPDRSSSPVLLHRHPDDLRSALPGPSPHLSGRTPILLDGMRCGGSKLGRSNNILFANDPDHIRSTRIVSLIAQKPSVAGTPILLLANLDVRRPFVQTFINNNHRIIEMDSHYLVGNRTAASRMKIRVYVIDQPLTRFNESS